MVYLVVVLGKEGNEKSSSRRRTPDSKGARVPPHSSLLLIPSVMSGLLRSRTQRTMTSDRHASQVVQAGERRPPVAGLHHHLEHPQVGLIRCSVRFELSTNALSTMDAIDCYRCEE